VFNLCHVLALVQPSSIISFPLDSGTCWIALWLNVTNSLARSVLWCTYQQVFSSFISFKKPWDEFHYLLTSYYRSMYIPLYAVILINCRLSSRQSHRWRDVKYFPLPTPLWLADLVAHTKFDTTTVQYVVGSVVLTLSFKGGNNNQQG
jgi:hypothetical protein